MAGLLSKAKQMFTSSRTPYIVLLGDVGTGKSTIVEKLSGETGRSSAASSSVTKCTETFTVPDGRGGSLIVADCPGSNAIDDKLRHNIWIAAAFNYLPVSKVLIVVKADTRVENTVGDARKYAEGLVDYDPAAWAVIVTHMDQVSWDEAFCKRKMDQELGIDTVLYSSNKTTGDALIRDFLSVCTKEHDLSIDERNFLRIFKISNSNVKYIRSTKKEVENFQDLIEQFQRETQDQKYSESEKKDVLFEFQAFMAEEITKAQQRMSVENDFYFEATEEGSNQAGHIANMTNQLRALLFNIRKMCQESQPNAGGEDYRKCPHCGQVWAKIVGCSGETTCGNMVNKIDSTGIMATFTFRCDNGRLRITKTGERRLEELQAQINDAFARLGQAKSAGCGRTISWDSMKIADLPKDFYAGPIGTNDINVVPEQAAPLKQKIRQGLDDCMAQMRAKGTGRRH